MDLVIKTYHGLPCACEVFTINGMRAYVDDFGRTEDMSPETAPEYGCGCRQFIPDIHEAKSAMEKYGLTIEEFAEVCDRLSEELFVGTCSWCA